LRSLLWKAEKSYTHFEFKEAMDFIKRADQKAFDWLSKITPRMWIRHGFDPLVRSDHVTNNMTKIFNHWIDDIRAKPVLLLIESLVVKIMGKIHKSFQHGLVWDSVLTPNSIKKIIEMRGKTSRCSLVPAGQMEFMVTDNRKRYPVDLKTNSCICKYWDLTGKSCIPFQVLGLNCICKYYRCTCF
jgi:hypothetical protein